MRRRAALSLCAALALVPAAAPALALSPADDAWTVARTAAPSAASDAPEAFSGDLFAGMHLYGGWHHVIEDGPRAVISRSGDGGYTLLLVGRPLSRGSRRSFTAPVRQDPADPLSGLATIWSRPGDIATLSLTLNADGSVLTVAVKEMHDGRAEDVFRDFALGEFKPDWPGDAPPASSELWWSNFGRTRIGRPRPGMILVDQLDAAGSVDRRMVVETQATAANGATMWTGPWVAAYGSMGGTGELRLSAAGDAFSGTLTRASGTLAWEATRDRPSNPPTPEPEQPPPSAETPAGDPTPPPAPPGSAGELGPFDVSFWGLERPRGSNVVRAVVAIRNESGQVQHLPSGTFRAILTDAEGAGQERNQLWRGSGEPAQLFSGTPALQPGRELTVRFTFNPEIRELDSLVLMRGEEQIEFDLAGR